MTAALRFDYYDWAGGREAMLRTGPDHLPTVIVASPLFEDANRCRALIVALLRALAVRGIGGALPDLPGKGESLVATRDATLDGWRQAFAAATLRLGGAVHVVAVRGGALVDRTTDATSRWYLSPLEGAMQVREIERVRSVTPSEPGWFAGNELAPSLVAAIEAAELFHTGPIRVVRLAGDPRQADAVFAAPPPWRTAEPQRHDALANTLADDIAAWVRQCAAR